MIDTVSLATPRPPQRNPIRNRTDWEAQRAAFLADPGAFFADIGRSIIHWYDPQGATWVTFDPNEQVWQAIDLQQGTLKTRPDSGEYLPWQQTFVAEEPPFYRWYDGGLTNACFNEVDRHVWAGHGDEVAFFFEGDRWDSSLNGGRGGPVVHETLTRKRLLLEVVKAALVLQNLGLKRGDRLALNMPNILAQVYYTEAAKRLGIVYTPVFGGFSDKTLSDRIHNAGARVVITLVGRWLSKVSGVRDAVRGTTEVGNHNEVETDDSLSGMALASVLIASPSASAEKPTEPAQSVVVQRYDAIGGHTVGPLITDVGGTRSGP